MKRTEGEIIKRIAESSNFADRVDSLIDAANGMTTEQARRAIEFGKVLLEIGMFPDSIETYQELLTKLEADHGA